MVADTSGLLAALDAGQAEHRRCQEVMRSSPLIVSPLVIAELEHLVRRRLGWDVATEALDLVLERLDSGLDRLAVVGRDDLLLARNVRQNYVSLRLDLADCVGVALAHRYRTNEIFTLDQRDFRAIVPLGRFTHFRILPADAA